MIIGLHWITLEILRQKLNKAPENNFSFVIWKTWVKYSALSIWTVNYQFKTL